MVITFVQKTKKQKYLALILIVLILATAFVLWLSFFRGKKLIVSAPPSITKPFRKVVIDFKILESPSLKEFQPFEKIPPLEEEIGRENPFLPY